MVDLMFRTTAAIRSGCGRNKVFVMKALGTVCLGTFPILGKHEMVKT